MLTSILRSRTLWTLWALVPVAGLSWHFGPGQRLWVEAQTRALVAEAQSIEAEAELLQERAHALHLESIDARLAQLGSESASYARIAADVAAREDEAYRSASAAWKKAAEKYGEAHAQLEAVESPRRDAVRVARSRALIRGGRIVEGVGDLEALLESFEERGLAQTALAAEAREEMATGYYYGARLLRVTGKPEAEWREVSGIARQNFRYLAETAEDESLRSARQRNVEVVLDLEQSGEEDLVLKPLPRNCPQGGNCDGLGKGRGKGRGPQGRERPRDARGAGGQRALPPGW